VEAVLPSIPPCKLSPLIPSRIFLQKCRSLARSKNPYLEVVDWRIRLAWTDDNVIGFMEWADALGLELTCDMLEEALSEAGGTTEVNGLYPINAAIRRRLGKLLNPK
jgi:hypothetical protein